MQLHGLVFAVSRKHDVLAEAGRNSLLAMDPLVGNLKVRVVSLRVETFLI